MSEIADALTRISDWLQLNGVSEILFPHSGLTYTQIAKKTEILPFRLSEEFYELYQWQNGNWRSGYILPFRVFYPLEESLAMFNSASQ